MGTTTIHCITGEELPRNGRVKLCASPEATTATFGRAALRDDHVLLSPCGRNEQREPEIVEGLDAYPFDPDPVEAGARLLGQERKKEKNNVVAYLGLCPQDSALNEDLSVEEHLIFFARLRGCPSPH